MLTVSIWWLLFSKTPRRSSCHVLILMHSVCARWFMAWPRSFRATHGVPVHDHIHTTSSCKAGCTCANEYYYDVIKMPLFVQQSVTKRNDRKAQTFTLTCEWAGSWIQYASPPVSNIHRCTYKAAFWQNCVQPVTWTVARDAHNLLVVSVHVYTLYTRWISAETLSANWFTIRLWIFQWLHETSIRKHVLSVAGYVAIRIW